MSELVQASGPALVSLYLPTERHRPAAEAGAIRLKNLLSAVRRQADERETDRKRLRARLAVLEPLLDDAVFWLYQDDGLALFAGDEGLRICALPLSVPEFALVGERYCVRPLLPAVSEGQRFHLLTISRNEARLFECSRTGIREIGADELAASLAEAEHEGEKSLQFHTGTPPSPGGGRRAALFHGQGLHKDARTGDTERLLRHVDAAVAALLGDREAPLALAGVSELVAAYRRLSGHPNLVEDSIEGNVEHLEPHELHARALAVVAPALDVVQRRVVGRVVEAAHTPRVITAIGRSLQAAADGQVEVLLVDAGCPVWGREDGDGGATRHRERAAGDDDLLDLCVARCWRSGARVQAVRADELPDSGELAALLRYTA